MNKKFFSILIAAALLLSGCGNEETEMTSFDVPSIAPGTIPSDISAAETSEMDFGFSDKDKEDVFDMSSPSAPNESEEFLTISSEGTYVISGNITDKTILVEADEEAKIRIVLDNANISNSKGCAIFIKSADKVFINAKEGTENTISDGTDYSLEDGNGSVDGAIYSKADLTINGLGKLTINGNYKHGIVSNDDLVVSSVTLNVNSKKVALNGKDCVKIRSCNLELTAGSDGIRSDNDEDSNRGFVYLESGNITINAANDGIQAETLVKIISGELNIVSGGGSKQTLANSEESYKGIKAGSDIHIQGGNFAIDSHDDSLHSNNTVIITGGVFKLSSGDDGIHADNDLSITSGTIEISKSYEGIESTRIFITGGDISITSSDDGLNAAGGNDGSSQGNRPGEGGFKNSNGQIVIAGGYVLINSQGDGIDSNGTFAITNGIVLVNGPTNAGNGALDYDAGASVTGGILIAVGNSGMAAGFTQAENQGAILKNISNQSGGNPIAICDSENKVLASFTPEKDYNSIVFTAPGMVKDGTYKIVAGGEIANTDKNGFAENSTVNGGTNIAEITLSNIISNEGGMGGKPNGGKPPQGGTPPAGGKPGGKR